MAVWGCWLGSRGVSVSGSVKLGSGAAPGGSQQDPLGRWRHPCPIGGTPVGQNKCPSIKYPFGWLSCNKEVAMWARADLPIRNVGPNPTSHLSVCTYQNVVEWARRGWRHSSWLRSRIRKIAPGMNRLGCLCARPFNRDEDTQNIIVGCGQEAPSLWNFPNTGGRELFTPEHLKNRKIEKNLAAVYIYSF